MSKRRCGFTLIELLVVIAINSVLIALLLSVGRAGGVSPLSAMGVPGLRSTVPCERGASAPYLPSAVVHLERAGKFGTGN